MAFPAESPQKWLSAVIEITGINTVCVALGLDIDQVRAMRQGAEPIDARTADWLQSAVRRLGGAETLEPEPGGSDDAPVTETSPPGTGVLETGVPEVEDPRETIGSIVQGVLVRATLMEGQNFLPNHRAMSRFDRALLEVLRLQLILALHFRQPLDPGQPAGKEGIRKKQEFIDSQTQRLRRAEEELRRSRGLLHRLLHWFRNPANRSSGDLYRQLVTELCAARGIDPGLALDPGIQNLGRFLYPEWREPVTTQWRRLDDHKRPAARALIEAINLAEEVQFRSPLPRGAELAAADIRLRMELMLIMELTLAPPSHNAYSPLLDYPDGPDARRGWRQMVATRLKNWNSLEARKSRCRGYGGRQWASDFFIQMIDESGAEECRQLAWIMDLDMGELCGRFLKGQGPAGYFDRIHLHLEPGDGS